jgi:tRNA (adenine57-N1/adenine58-N1)-methyltransferase
MGSNVFRLGDLILIIGPVGRPKERYVQPLSQGGRFTTRFGVIEHAEILGKHDGSVFSTNRSVFYAAFKPTYAEYILAAKRNVQVIYPKDAATMLMWGDVHPGLDILEAGIGLGALSIALLRALAGKGRLVSYEAREDFLKNAQSFIERFFGEPQENHRVVLGDIYSGFEGVYDRIFLDLPEPWHVVAHTKDGLRAGGILVAYIPTVLQVKTYVDALRDSRFYLEIETFETIRRPWRVEGLSVRPELWMFSHSAFLVTARRILN